MLKYVLLAGAMTIAGPALAQTQPVPTAPAPVTGAAPAQTQTAPAQDPANAPASAAMATEAMPPSDPQVAQTQPAPNAAAPADAAPAQALAAAPANKSEQVAAVVSSEFPTYDKNSDGKLSNTEFASWMVALKTASDPATKANSAATKTWIGKAFASADADKNKSVSQDELNGFLSQG